MSKAFLLQCVAVSTLLLAAVGFASSQSGSSPSGTPKPKAAEAPSVMAVSFYASWCPGCKQLAPKVQEIVKAAAKEPCLFVTLDQSDKESRQAEYLLASLGMGELWKEHAGKTGYVLLVDTKSKKIAGTISADQSVDQMKETLSKALGTRL